MSEFWILVFMWCLVAIADGIRDAYTFHRNPPRIASRIDPHALFNMHRTAITLVFMVVLYPMLESFWLCLAFTFALGLLFPFFHDGAYYTYRNKLDPGLYPRGWLDWSTTSTAKLTQYLTPLVRIILAVIGFILVILIHNINR